MTRAALYRVFVLVGPFNEHMLTDTARQVYQARRHAVEAWLRQNDIPHSIPPPLPSDLYADASHPLAGGYRMLADDLFENEAFARFLGTPAGGAPGAVKIRQQ